MTKEEYLQRAEQGHAKTQCSVGVFYYKGINGFEKDYDKAFYWIKKSASQGYSFAIYRLAVCYIEGKGVERNKDKGMEYIKKAANLGDEDANHFLMEINVKNPIQIDDDPYKDDKQMRNNDNYKSKRHLVKDESGITREIKINAALIVIAALLAGAATVLFLIVFGDRWTPDIMGHRLKLMAVGSFLMISIALILGRYLMKIINRILDKRH